MAGRNLVVFFSVSGRTRLVAKAVAKELGADLEEIAPVNQYPLRGAWLYMLGGMQAMLNRTPPIKRLIVDLNDYDTVFVGSPVWAGKMAPPMRTFLAGDPLVGKKVAFFCTHGGSQGECLQGMEELAQGQSLGQVALKMGVKVANESLSQARSWAQNITQPS
jgi:flavodoxin